MSELTAEQQLLADVRNYLDITWVDPAGDTKLAGLIARGKAYLDDIAGTALDYAEEGDPRALLFDYARYGRTNALDEIPVNFQSALIRLQLTQEVATYAAEAAADV
jgi:hypothetical protein